MKPIKRLILDFPHGVSVEAATEIARDAVRYAQAGISEGGMRLISGNFNTGEMRFASDEMQFEFGHSREADEKANRPKGEL